MKTSPPTPTAVPPVSFVGSSQPWRSQDCILELFSPLYTHFLGGLCIPVSGALNTISKLMIHRFISQVYLFSAQYLYFKVLYQKLIPNIAPQTSSTCNLPFKVVGHPIFPEAQDTSLSDFTSKSPVNPVNSTCSSFKRQDWAK